MHCLVILASILTRSLIKTSPLLLDECKEKGVVLIRLPYPYKLIWLAGLGIVLKHNISEKCRLIGFFVSPCSCLCLVCLLDIVLDWEVTCSTVCLLVCSNERTTGGTWCWLCTRGTCRTMDWRTVFVAGICTKCWRRVLLTWILK